MSDDVDFLVSNTSLSQATVHRISSKLKAGEPVQRKKGGGRPRCFVASHNWLIETEPRVAETWEKK